jgi:trans-aconitate methyltransferase
MTLTEEYEQQNQWRNWNFYLQELPIRKTDIILDLGCDTGQVSQLLAERSL